MASAKHPNALARWYARFAAFDVAALFARKREPGPPRTVYVHEDLPPSYLDHKGKVKHEHVYATNQVITSKYTIITFLPRNLLEQFRRIANIFFLVIAILQFFPKFSTITPAVAILPLIIIVVVTAVKDGYEDIKRHQSDQRVNYSKVRVLDGGDWKNPNAMQSKSKTFVRALTRGGSSSNADIEYDGEGPDLDDEKAGIQGPHWKKVHWEDLKVGDFVKLVEGESFPADILICSTSEEEDVAFVETKNLDGETNLKSRNAVASLTHLRDAKSCANRNNAFHINCDKPDTDMYRLKANVEINGTLQPVDLSMTLLRGTVLRNTAWAIGVVLYTGYDSKIILNSGGTPSKRSKVERQMNPQVFVNLAILATLSVVCAIADSALEHHYFPRQAPWLYGDIYSDDNPSINGLITLIYSVLTFQILVPISLYISIEIVRTAQAVFIYLDSDIRYEKTGQSTICKSWNLADDLGQIEYIFSDKTGTLTQNSMVFRQCSIGGKAYRGDEDVIPMEATDSVKAEKYAKSNPEDPVEVNVWDSTAASTSSRMDDSPNSRFKAPPTTAADVAEHFKDSDLLRDLEEAVSDDPNPENAQHHRLLNGFFTVLGLCHTVLTSTDPDTGKIEYKAQSPDEAALVQAAADCGFVFCGREKEIVSIRTPSSAPDVERYELLNILEFTSARKRMSVVLRKLDDDHRLFLLSKGADNVIFQRLKESERPLMDETEEHLSEFANQGLRTLTLAYKVISEEYYQEWSERYHEATIAMDNREEKIEAVSDELEQDLRLLGATAIEDRLQDGVPEAIADLKKAGIKIWVATGDKLETAIAIGRSTNLIASDSNIIIVRGSNQAGKPTIHQQMVQAMEQFFPEYSIDQELRPRASTSSRDIPLRRMSTSSVASIVGAGNGERPGGFILVVDGAALLHAFENDQSRELLLQLSTLCEAVVCCRVSPLQKALIVKLVKDGLGAMCLAIGDGANDVSMIQAADVGVGISGEEGLQAVNSSDYAIGQFRFLKKLLLVHGHWSYARNGTMILNFFYKNIVPVFVLWWFQIYSGWSGYFVFDYVYILFWNSLWTVLPVIGLGLFDRFLESEVLMSVPQLYHFGRRGTWFGLKYFLAYAFDGIYQSVIVFFFIAYTYWTTSSRTDGYQVSMYEFSTVMAVIAVMIADIYAGLNATAWTIPLWLTILFGIVVVWGFTIVYSLISPGYAITSLYGNYYYLFTSAYFWLCIPLVFFLALGPRIIFKAWKFGYTPDDIDIIRYVYKKDPNYDFSRLDTSDITPLRQIHNPSALRSGAFESTETLNMRRPKRDSRAPSRVDMATGVTSVDRGFDFAAEENGVAMRRMQSHLSEARASSRNLPRKSSKSSVKKGKEAFSRVFSLKRVTKRPSILRRSEADT